jgi:hypothetical protein
VEGSYRREAECRARPKTPDVRPREVVSEFSSPAAFAALGVALTGRVAGMTWWRA